jgi:hypothetical protein
VRFEGDEHERRRDGERADEHGKATPTANSAAPGTGGGVNRTIASRTATLACIASCQREIGLWNRRRRARSWSKARGPHEHDFISNRIGTLAANVSISGCSRTIHLPSAVNSSFVGATIDSSSGAESRRPPYVSHGEEHRSIMQGVELHVEKYYASSGAVERRCHLESG